MCLAGMTMTTRTDQMNAAEVARKQQQPLRNALQADAEKLAMFDALVDALDEVTADYHHTDSAFWNSKIALVRRARAIK